MIGSCPVKCLIYDPFLPWALGVAKRCGLLGASFLAQSCAVDLIYYNGFEVKLNAPPIDNTLSLPGLSYLETKDLRTLVAFPDNGSFILAREQGSWIGRLCLL